jgi:hypothetical protein
MSVNQNADDPNAATRRLAVASRLAVPYLPTLPRTPFGACFRVADDPSKAGAGHFGGSGVIRPGEEYPGRPLVTAITPAWISGALFGNVTTAAEKARIGVTDPISIALGAVVGGTAGKVAGKAWDAGERWLRERFGSHPEEIQGRARSNAAEFVDELSRRVQALEDARGSQRDLIEATTRHPAFSALLQRSLINAAQTDQKSKHDLLAGLVAARLTSHSETTLALVSDLASDAILRATANQLKLMALACFLDEIRPLKRVAAKQYREWVAVHLMPFAGFEFHDIDARHLVAIGCATYDRASGRGLIVLLETKGGVHCIGKSNLEDLPEVEELQFHWVEGLAGVFLTSVGSLVGGLAYDQLCGHSVGLPHWARDATQ